HVSGSRSGGARGDAAVLREAGRAFHQRAAAGLTCVQSGRDACRVRRDCDILLTCPAMERTGGNLAPSAAALAALALAGVELASGCTRAQPAARPGCGKDDDCKGARVCTAGQCRDPEPRAAAPDAGPASPSGPREPGSPPFAMFGGDARHTGLLAGPVPERAPSLVWKVATGGPIVGSPTVGPGGTIHVASHDGKLYAISPAGKVLWTFATGDRIWSTPAIAEDGTIYVGSDDDHLYAVDGASGREKWRFRIGDCDSTAFGPEGVRC